MIRYDDGHPFDNPIGNTFFLRTFTETHQND